jgi:2,4-dienoyl-CoA reductase (NADPH2)
MARPFLADPEILLKAQEGRADEINTCIGCNQACLDHIFQNKMCSCLVNPKACHEVEFENLKDKSEFHKKSIAVIGAGPSGISFAIEAKSLGHDVTIFEARDEIGGQFNIAKEIPGKEEFHETIRYFKAMIKKLNIEIKLNTKVDLDDLKNSNFDSFVFSTGIIPRIPKMEGFDHPKALNYSQVLLEKMPVGKKVAIIGAGGIGFDTAEFLLHDPSHKPTSLDKEEFFNEWGIDTDYKTSGALKEKIKTTPFRDIVLLQRKETKHGKNLGKTTGWIHRQSLVDKDVKMVGGITYKAITDQGLEIEREGKVEVISVDNVIFCAGQLSENKLFNEFKASDTRNAYLIGGALKASEIDAKRAIDEGIRLAYEI